MQNSQDLAQIQDLRNALAKGDEKHVKAQRDAKKLTARERIEKIADVGSFVELFAFVSSQEEAAGVITGYATVQERPVYLFAQDFTVHGGAIGKLQALKINKILDMALKTGAPVLMLCDSAGVRIDEGAEAMNAYAEIYRSMSRLSGVCPMISVILGPCIGGAALLAQLSDISIMARDVGQLMMFGPQVLSAMNGIDVNADKVGGADMMAAQGGCSLVAANEDEAILKALALLALLPGSNAEDAELLEGDDLNRLLPAIEPADTAALMAQVLDVVKVAGLDAVMVAAELALERAGPSGRVSPEHVGNVLARLTAPPRPENVATALGALTKPIADTARYDRLRRIRVEQGAEDA